MTPTTEGLRDEEEMFPRWLLVVRRDQTVLYHSLRQVFGGHRRFDVVLDRRDSGLRPGPVPVRTERRRRLTASERALWDHVGFRIVYIPADGAGRRAGGRR
jgi:hypothetical protein